MNRRTILKSVIGAACGGAALEPRYIMGFDPGFSKDSEFVISIAELTPWGCHECESIHFTGHPDFSVIEKRINMIKQQYGDVNPEPRI